MKKLMLLRHAKTASASPGQPDYERQLTDRGHSDADAIGRWLAAAQISIDSILSSTAQRARQTVDHINEYIGLEAKTQWTDELYAATTETLENLVKSTAASSEQILVVGHNPGLEKMISGLCTGDTELLQLSLPTGGLAQITLEVEHWGQAKRGCGVLLWFMRPQLIRTDVVDRLISE